MKKLTYAMYMNDEIIPIKKEDEQAILNCFKNNIELTFDEYGRVYDEAGTYIADIEV